MSDPQFKTITIHTIHPKGWPVDFEIDPATTKTAEAIEFLTKYNFTPAPTAAQAEAQDYKLTPEGLPICPKHNAVMRKREKQGDVWHSHAVADSNDVAQYCRGYEDPKLSPGWQL